MSVFTLDLSSELIKKKDSIKNNKRGARLAQSGEHVTLDLGVVSSSPMLSVELT